MDTATTTGTSVIESLSSAEGGVLRFLACGSVDDGKSTLIGRLLYDTKLIFEDQMEALERDSRKHGTTGEEVDFALLLDGLEAEREQGITIDVAYRFFSTDKRKFIVADTPGHEQYTRNMATGASTADVAVILIDARKGVLSQTKRHTFIAHLLGIRHIVVAVNKMDLMDYSRSRFHEIIAEYLAIAEPLGFGSIVPIPMSARYGENVCGRSDKMAWHSGPTLLEHLEELELGERRAHTDFRLPVQWVNRPNLDFRGFAGTIAAGEIAPGDEVVVAKSGKTSKVKTITTSDGDLDKARFGDAITLTLEDEIDISRGDIICGTKNRPEVANQFAANIIWMHEAELTPGRSYLLKTGTATIPATVTSLKHKIDINSMEKQPGRTLALNEIGFCNLQTAQPIAFDPYSQVRETGGFILIDRITNQTVGAGMIEYSLRRSGNIHRHAMDVDKSSRSALKGHKPAILWFTGLSGAGKSTIANLVEQRLAENGVHTYSLDGDNVRYGLNKDLGFTDGDRVENIRRIGEVARLFVDAGVVVTCSFISPFRAERRMVRELVDDGEFIEAFVDAPIEVCMQRDPKGLYEKAKTGEIKNFTGLDSPYESPEAPELHLDTTRGSAEDMADLVIERLRAMKILP